VAIALRMPERELAALVEDPDLPPVLRPALATVGAPVKRVDLEGDGRLARCWVGLDGACLVLPTGRGDERQVVALEPHEVGDALARAVAVNVDAPAPPGAVVSLTPGELAVALAVAAEPVRTAALPAPLGQGLEAHWRASADGVFVEAINTVQGAWRIVPLDEGPVELRPVAGSELLALLTALANPHA
jgi:hypothetical protein